ncbi:pre-B-cell leukemia transcription factor 1-like [Arapaima gigas]
MDEQTRMLAGLTALGALPQADVGESDPVRKQQQQPPGPPLGQPQQDIGDILQQIMAITDESLDEAQARCVWYVFCGPSDPLSPSLGSAQLMFHRAGRTNGDCGPYGGSRAGPS